VADAQGNLFQSFRQRRDRFVVGLVFSGPPLPDPSSRFFSSLFFERDSTLFFARQTTPLFCGGTTTRYAGFLVTSSRKLKFFLTFLFATKNAPCAKFFFSFPFSAQCRPHQTSELSSTPFLRPEEFEPLRFNPFYVFVTVKACRSVLCASTMVGSFERTTLCRYNGPLPYARTAFFSFPFLSAEKNAAGSTKPPSGDSRFDSILDAFCFPPTAHSVYVPPRTRSSSWCFPFAMILVIPSFFHSMGRAGPSSRRFGGTGAFAFPPT